MNDANRPPGELARPISATGTVVDILAGNGVRALPSLRPVVMTPPVGGSPSPMGLLRALKRRAALALGLAILVSSASATAAWFLLPPPKYKATARLHVASHHQTVAFKTSDFQQDTAEQTYRRYQKTQIALLKSRQVISGALLDPRITKPTPAMIKELDEPVDWLLDNLEVQFPQESEVLEISLDGDRPDELWKVVNAVEQAYLDVVVNRDRLQRMDRLERLRKLTKTYQGMMKAQRDTLRRQAQDAGSDDKQTLVLQQQFAMEHLASVKKDLHEVQSKRRQIEAMLKVQRPDGLQETSAPTVPPAEVERMIEQDGDVSALRARLAEMEDRLASETAHTGRVARNASLNPALKALRDEVEQVKKQLDRKRKAIRPAVIRQLQNPKNNDPTAKGGGSLSQQLAVLQEVEKTLEEEKEKLSQAGKAAHHQHPGPAGHAGRAQADSGCVEQDRE